MQIAQLFQRTPKTSSKNSKTQKKTKEHENQDNAKKKDKQAAFQTAMWPNRAGTTAKLSRTLRSNPSLHLAWHGLTELCQGGKGSRKGPSTASPEYRAMPPTS